ncbi:ABC transporter substrate-binding protein [Streptomyces sp. NPDC058398]|uniref:ABC transporter substrate-binding protein n=1 Tax=Streptomyces sp. NPDC058398 TaxID=3346479 RepID=UPI003668FBB7
MPRRPPLDAEPHRTVSADLHRIVRVLDPYVIDRRAGATRRHRSREHGLPALLLARLPDGGAATDTAEPDPGLTALVLDYGERLKSSGGGVQRDGTHFAPHAVVGDVGPDPTRVREDGPHLLLLEDVAEQLRESMPQGAGALRLPEFDTCLSVLRAPVQDDDAAGQRRTLRKLLCDTYAARFHEAFPVAQFGEAMDGWWGAPFRLLSVVARWLWRRWYGMRVDRRHPWVSRVLDLPGRSFLNAAVQLRLTHQLALAHEAAHPTRAAESREEELVREILLTALIHDLARAARPRAWSRLRPRRAWPFVVLLPTVGGAGSACREFLDTYAAVAHGIANSPLLVLGAATDELPPYAASPPLRAFPAQRGALGTRPPGHEATTPFSAAVAGHATDAVRVLALPRTPDDGTTVAEVPPPTTVDFRPPRISDWWRPVAAVTTAAMLCGGGLVLSREVMDLLPDGSLAASCRHVGKGEVVGLTDGNDGCDLAHGEYAADLRKLEKTLGRQNAKVRTDQPYRTIVFFAPLSVGSESKRTAPIGFQTLRGALLAQKNVNSRHLKAQVPVRLLVANAGEYFRFGSRGGLNKTNSTDVDVARMIVDRADRDHIAAVMGLHQSRPESQQAAIELGAQGITVLGTGVSGQRMVDGDSPVSYFQLSPTDARIAAVMASFALHSPQLRALTDPAPGSSGPAAVVVYDPKDTYFSADLARRFDSAYRSTGAVHLVKYGEMDDGRTTRAIADTVCTLVHRTGGFVLYAGRSSVMEDLFEHMQSEQACRARVAPVPVLAESPAPDVILHPDLMHDEYDALKLFYNQFSLPAPGGPFGQKFRRAFHLSAENDAALGYDAVKILSEAMNAIFSTDPAFSPSALVTHLQDPGIHDYVGESGVITLNSDHHYPPDKEIHVREITPAGDKITDLTCGVLSQGARNVTHWGPGGSFDCPLDTAS